MAQIRNGQIETHIADIDHFVTGKVHLSAGSITKADVFLCATGRKFKPRMSSAGVSEDELGLPSNEVSATGMEQKADEGIYTRYPMLQSPPEGNPNNHELNGLDGVTMVEDLVEQGFDTVGFERNEYIGGLWRYSTDTNQMTVLKSKSLQQMPPVRHIVNVPDYPSGEEVAAYSDFYAAHFNLAPHFRLRTTINRLDRWADGYHWTLGLSKPAQNRS
ncbi:MAG: hypothetical protein LQ340_000285 [Diploschistes diacapsis]|nr:MAG: hypothetical protein LQ340_000285 [Diploschistes diacapsis]